MDLTGKPLADLVKLYRAGQERKDAIMADARARAARAEEITNAARLAILSNLAAAGTNSATGEFGRVNVAVLQRIGVRAGGWDEFFAWASTNGHTEMIKKGVSSNAVKAWMKENEGVCPPGLSVAQEKTLRVTAAKPKQEDSNDV